MAKWLFRVDGIKAALDLTRPNGTPDLAAIKAAVLKSLTRIVSMEERPLNPPPVPSSVASALRNAKDEAAFDRAMAKLYDWADALRVWVE